MESIFNTIYTLCADNEKYYIQNKDKFWFKLLGYKNIKKYLYKESKNAPRELKRAIVHVEAIHAIYPEFII